MKRIGRALAGAAAVAGMMAMAALPGAALAQSPSHGASHAGHVGHAPADGAKAPAAPGLRAQPVLDAHTLEDIERHQGMARAHSQAAQCMQSGQAHDLCLKQLQMQCKGLALGKSCGLRHAH